MNAESDDPAYAAVRSELSDLIPRYTANEIA